MAYLKSSDLRLLKADCNDRIKYIAMKKQLKAEYDAKFEELKAQKQKEEKERQEHDAEVKRALDLIRMEREDKSNLDAKAIEELKRLKEKNAELLREAQAALVEEDNRYLFFHHFDFIHSDLICLIFKFSNK